MKKLALTLAIVLTMGLTGLDQSDNHQGGMFQRGAEPREYSNGLRDPDIPMLPTQHGEAGDQTSPLGSGIIALIGLGAAYLVSKKRREE